MYIFIDMSQSSRVNFQTNLACFCWIIAIFLGVNFFYQGPLFSGHSVHWSV